jgi:hypothetical protein
VENWSSVNERPGCIGHAGLLRERHADYHAVTILRLAVRAGSLCHGL